MRASNSSPAWLVRCICGKWRSKWSAMSDAAAIGLGTVIIGCLIVGMPLVECGTTRAGLFARVLRAILLIARTVVWRVTRRCHRLSFSPVAIWSYVFFSFEILSSVSSMLLFIFLSRTIDRTTEATRNACLGEVPQQARRSLDTEL
jgi:hypothetical protein